MLYTCCSVVYQSSENRDVLLWGCISLWPVKEAFAGWKQLVVSIKKKEKKISDSLRSTLLIIISHEIMHVRLI